ncbi:MAG: ATP-dependent sacrificial sulfur transferase LarE [Methanomassiliicoccales archaeon]
MTAEQKLNELRRTLRSLGTVGVAYSGGLDSSFLLKIALEELGEKAVAFMGVSPAFPTRERETAISLAASIGARLITLNTNELELEEYISNPEDRCYYCKNHILKMIISAARELGFLNVIDGTNADDFETHRHGIRAAQELGVRSPLSEVGLTKEEIRSLAGKIGLASANRPSSPCLATRVPYGQKITREKLAQIEGAENILKDLGSRQVRVRHHGEIARIEVLADDFLLLLTKRDKIVKDFKKIGFKYVCLDLEGYRSGSLELS